MLPQDLFMAWTDEPNEDPSNQIPTYEFQGYVCEHCADHHVTPNGQKLVTEREPMDDEA